MEQFATEEQQVEAIKTFLRENGLAIVLGAVLGLGGLWGYRYYGETQIQAKETASTEYQTLIESGADGNIIESAQGFMEAQAGTAYASLAGLIAAQTAVVDGDYDTALVKLKQVVAATDDPQLQALANLRLARVQFELTQYEEALASLSAISVEAFSAAKFAVKGDVLSAQGNIDAARDAYVTSLAAEDDRAVQMRLDNLAVADAG